MTLIPNTAYTAKEIYDVVQDKLIIARVKDNGDAWYDRCIYHTDVDTLSFIYNSYKSGKTLHSLGLTALVAEQEKNFWHHAEYRMCRNSVGKNVINQYQAGI